eukprot:TRINITY_DN753_c2_g1_i1.p1 TRINITY_DN753_c2_g1~~TRINITY_DN753_c2_g1_i1.p1  ORF type:complete len:5769 (+),score=1470.87 TRINITY_DN753_c2_g1_i1:1766-17308(+)
MKGDKAVGHWSHKEQSTPSSFICSAAASTPVSAAMSWGAKAMSSTAKELGASITSWDASRFDACQSAEELITGIITDTRSKKHAEHEKYILNLWQIAVKQIINRAWMGQVPVDKWILQQGLCSLMGVQKKAAELLLKEYFSSRTISWCDAPIDYSSVEELHKVYPAASKFMQQIKKATQELQRRLSEHRISRRQYTTLEFHYDVHQKNGLVLPSTPLNFQAPTKALAKVKSILRQLITSWRVVGAQDILATVETQLVNKDVSELKELEDLVAHAGKLLGPILQLQDAVSSPILHAHFVKHVERKVELKNFVATFNTARAAINAITLDTLVRDAVAGLHPPKGRVAGARLQQEQAFLRQLGCAEEIVKALTEGALPLRFIVHDLRILREFIQSPRQHLQLRSDFLTEDEKELLLNPNLDNIPLRDTVMQKEIIEAATVEELHPVLELMRTVYNCGELIEFTRENPEAQDAGLSNVLSNSRDLQHASFQTFLNCAPFINPFIAASAAYEHMRLPGSNDFGVPLLASRSVDGGDGFWKVLSDLTSHGSTDIKGVQRSIEKMSTRDQIEGLQKMIRDQNGSTDALIALCQQATSSEPATIRINLPATGQPYLECEIGDIVKSGPEYQDIVYRATLQKNLDATLEKFTAQAREVLRAFNAACALHSEGHIEFRSRVLTLEHMEGARVTAMLQILQGTWSARDNSAMEQACLKYSELACLTPSELVCVSELMRSVCSSGELTAHEAAVLSQRWRHIRNPITHGAHDSRRMWDEMVEQSHACGAPAPTPYKLMPAASPPQAPKKNESLVLSGCGPADGVYCEGLWLYKRNDGAVLAPVTGGWVVYDSTHYMSQSLLVSVCDHYSNLEPWEMGDWRVLGADASPSLDVVVQTDDSHVIPPTWSEVSRSRDEEIHVVTKSPLKPLDVVASDGTSGALYVLSVDRYSLWESLGFEKGMRILAVDGVRGTPDQLTHYLNNATRNAKIGFKVLVEPPSVWSAVSKDLDVSPNGREVCKVRGKNPSLACSQFLAGRVWRVKVTGDVMGMRIGLCTTKLNHHLSEVDTGVNKSEAFWYMRCGSLRHNGVDVALKSAFRSGDIITVTHDLVHRTIEFALNGRDIGARFTGVTDPLLRPCVYLAKKSANVMLSPGAPVKGVLKWSDSRKSKNVSLRNNGSCAFLAQPSSGTSSETGPAGVVTSDTVLSGPGPHVFEVRLTGNSLSEAAYIGVAPPGVFQQFQASSMYGFTVRPDGNVFGLQESRILYHGAKPDPKLKDLLFTFIVDLGEGTVEVLCNGDRVVHSSLIKDFPRATGPLVPYAVLIQSDVNCELRMIEEPKPSTKDPAVVIKSARGCAADGLYHKWIPTYTRSDGRFNMFHWNGRWCVADASDVPCAWSSKCPPERTLGTDPVRWTVVRNFEATPKYLRLVTPAKPGGVLKLQPGQAEDKVVYLNDDIKLSWYKAAHRWVITPTNSRVPASGYYMSATTTSWLPHYCTNWYRGDGTAWYQDDRIYLEPCTPLVPLKQDSEGLVWPQAQCPQGHIVSLGLPFPEPFVSLGTTIKAKVSKEQSTLDAMSPDELAGWHIVHKACGVLCKASDLRVALKQASEGMENGKELRMSWESPKEALRVITAKAASQLDRIGRLFKGFKNTSPLDPLISDNYTPGAIKYGQLQATSIDAPVIDTSRLSVSDRKLFLLSLFNDSLRPYHILDCTPYTPVEDVHAFLLLFKLLKKGRLAISNLQELSPDLQNEVRQRADESHSEKELIAVITEGDGTDETVSFVDNQTCDVRWRKWTMERAVKLSKFESITYFCQGPGTGKSYTIQRQVELGVWGGKQPTLLDIDSTNTSLENICRRLMAPLRATSGLLIIHVGHDTPHAIVNQVLDSLVFFGRLQSQSGLSVIAPKRGWHLVVEFQHPPAPEKDRVVNDPWKKPDGTSDITLLACRGLAAQGSIIPYDVSVVSGAADALDFLKSKLQHLPSDNNTLAKMLALGLERVPNDDTLEAATPRLITRALKFLVQQYQLFQPSTSSNQIKVSQSSIYKLVAQALIHEMRHYVHPFDNDHFHLCLAKNQIRGSVQLSGSISGKLQASLDEYHKSITHRICVMKKSTSVEEQRIEEERAKAHREELATAPLYALIGILADEVGVKKKWVTTCLSSKQYVLIPDFLQKLVQLRSHLFLNDPPILQGPSGTGKSCAVSLLCDLMQLPSETSSGTTVRSGYNDLSDTLFKRFIRSSQLKRLFPTNSSDVEVGGARVMWNAQCHKPTDNAKECLLVLAENNLVNAVQYVRETVNDVLGPLINDTRTNPDIAALLNVPLMNDAVNVMNGRTEQSDPGIICDSLIKVMEELSKVSGFFLAEQTTQCFESALRSEKMRDLAGTCYDALIKILDKKHTHDSFRTWAEHAFINARSNKDEFCRQVRQILRSELEESPLLKPPPEVLEALSDSSSDGKLLGETICKVLDLKREPSCFHILMRYDMTPELLFKEMCPILEKAMACKNVLFMIMIDEMNATKMLGLIKRIIVDRYWDKWEDLHPYTKGRMPENVAFVGAVNPSKKDASLEGVDQETCGGGEVEDLGFDVTPMPPSLLEFVVPWKQLAEDQRKMFISRLVASNKNIFSANIKQALVETLSTLLLGAHRFTQKLSQNKRTTVSQREIHRAMKLFDFFFERQMDFVYSEGERTQDSWKIALSSMLLGIAVSYYFRFSPEQRLLLSEFVSDILKRHLGLTVIFSDVVGRSVAYYCNKNHLKLPDAVYSHQGLLENLFVQMICFHLRIAVILQGAPGTSKTLSNNIIRDNMTGTGTFWRHLCHISDVCRYQGSAQSSAEEIKRKCVEAYEKQKEADSSGTRNKRTLLFVDEAGLVNGETDGRKWALKVLHYYLEGANLASVLMTNVSLDPAIGNRCIVVYMAKPRPEELANMCAGILHKNGFRGLTETAKLIIPACCDAFRTLVPPAPEDEPAADTDPSAKFRWWYGLRDLFHMMRYIRRKNTTDESGAVTVTPELVVKALERNFNGPPEFFEKVLQVFGDTLQKIDANYATTAMKKLLRGRLSVFINSIDDNNRALDTGAGKNLNDMWVRFKLVVDNTEDGSILQLLRQSKIHNFEDLSVLSLSALSTDDELLPVAVVSQIAAAMETGKSVWLTNTRLIDACLFDVFNQNYVVASSGNNEVLHFVAVAVGAALEYKRVHKDFQCIVHVTKAELAGMGKTLPSPFLNRLEKFILTVDDIVEHLAAGLPKQDRITAAQCRQLLESFERTLSIRNRCIFSDTPRESFDSIILEAIQSGSLQPLAMHPYISSDKALDHFVNPERSVHRIWRTMSCRLLQLLKPEGMLIAQRVLKEGAPAYLRAYFKDLAPWSFTGYLNNLRARVQGTPNMWLRSTIFSPNNVDFPSLLGNISGVTFVTIHDLIESERGHEDLQEAVLKFSLDEQSSVFVVVMRPQSLGRPECREVKDILEAPPEIQKACSKAVVVLQPFQCTVLTDGGGCTPIFGTGWNQVFIDAAAENAKIDLLRYVDADIMQAPRALPDWKDMEALLYPAMNSLMQAQSKASARWVPMKNDPASALYDMNKPFGEQVTIAKKLFNICPAVRKTLLDLHCSRIPTKQEMIEMAKEVAAHGGAQSMAQRLIDEENKAPRALLIIALRYLLTDRNASALLTLHETKGPDLERSDALVSQALHITCQATTFDMLRRMKVNSLETLVIGATMPALPGSAFLMEILEINSMAVDAKVTAEGLKQKYGEGSVGDLVRLVERDEASIISFFKDCIRTRVMYTDAKVVTHTVNWVLELARGLHRAIFQRAETVWTVRALCVVEAAAIDDFILAMTPLAAMGALDHIKPQSSLRNEKHDDDWVTHELGPKLLIEALPKMTSTTQGLEQFRMACSSMLHRVTPEWAVRSKYIPCLAVLGAMLSTPTPALSQIIMFTNECMNVTSTVPIHLPSIRKVLDATPQATSKVVLELARLAVKLQGAEELCTFSIELGMSRYVTRAMAARVFSYLATPNEVLSSSFLPKLFLKIAESQMKVTHQSYVYNAPVKEKSAKKKEPSILKAKIYTTAYDVCYDSVLGPNAERLMCFYEIAQEYFAHLEDEKSFTCNAKLLYSAVYKRSLEIGFLQALAHVFSRPATEASKDWAPSFVKDTQICGLVSKLAKRLMEPKGFVCPGRSDKQVDIAPDKEENILIFLNALQQGVGVSRGMGTKAVLEYLQDQVGEERGSALINVCGEAMKNKCVNADALETRPGDLPLVYSTGDPLYDPFINLRVVLNNTTHDLRRLIDKLQSFCGKYSKEQVRLLLFYAAFKCYFGEKVVHPCAKEISKDPTIARLLDLKANQQRVLYIGFNNTKVTKFPNGPVGVTEPLLEGFSNEWTEMICTAMVIACAKPDSLFGSLFLDIDAQKSCYIPGDRTEHPLTEGGCYKIDCVTQLDESGKIAEYGKNQPVLSKGACYLLWGIEFGALALQLAFFPDTYSTMARWVVSPALHLRRYQYQQGGSDYKHLVGQLTERSTAYHLHMGINSGLSVDEAQRMYAFFMYHGVMNGVASRQQCRSRSEALDVEKEVEGFWKEQTQNRTALSAPSGVAHNSRSLMSLYVWIEDSQPDDLPRFGSVFTELTCMSADQVPRLLDIALHENEKLALLAPLITDIYSFSSRVHRMLSNRLYIKYTSGGEEMFTPYVSVLELFEKHTPRSQFEAALEQLSRIKLKWNTFMERVGPIDFECEAGGINITMSDDVRVGAAGMPDTLDFWITMEDSPDPNHRNLIKAALLSLIDKYNKCQGVVVGFTKTMMEDVDPVMLNPSKPDLTLREHKGLGEVCRSHVTPSGVDWAGIENELRFASGLILPRLLMPDLPSFRFVDPEEPLTSNDIEQSTAHLLALHPDRYNVPMPEALATAVAKAVRHFSEEQVGNMLTGLSNTFKAQNTQPDDPLYSALVKRFGKDCVMPSSALVLKGAKLCHLRSLMKLFLKKMECCDWTTAHIHSDYQHELSDEMVQTFDTQLKARLTRYPPDVVIEDLEAMVENAGVMCNGGSEYLGDPTGNLMDLISGVMMDGEDGICSVFEGVLIRHIVFFMRYLQKKLHRLRNQVSAKTWAEDGADLYEVPVRVGCEVPLGVEFEGLTVISVQADGSGAKAGLTKGMRVVAFNGQPVTDGNDLQTHISRATNTYELSISITPQEFHFPSRLAIFDDKVAGDLEWHDLCVRVKQAERDLTAFHA